MPRRQARAIESGARDYTPKLQGRAALPCLDFIGGNLAPWHEITMQNGEAV